jgi:hypothetical protein
LVLFRKKSEKNAFHGFWIVSLQITALPSILNVEFIAMNSFKLMTLSSALVYLIVAGTTGAAGGMDGRSGLEIVKHSATFAESRIKGCENRESGARVVECVSSG